ncbi:type II secretion system minor pseudopilin GspH [Sansalvadorimonas sp. 2012CJ34-2]|uniref:Type II secretion system protein H n=1 Tax=Parendozoicomonas callyspongiae TaxID=2942213 RepID=A0ABT0PBI6_9GAMM|nr:type II secretion system minor pseudopilin GspH [Sansalvadorimonas sp. 2012CJ34-2]
MKGRSRLVRQNRIQAFTLLEVLLVIVLIGLAATLIAPVLPKGSGVQQLQKESRRIVELCRIARQQAVMDGRSLGLGVAADKSKKTSVVQFLFLKKQKWHPLERDRLLGKFSLPEDITLTLTPGDSFWQQAIENEQDSGLLNTDLFDIEQKPTPDIYFWSSGEVSPVQLRLCLKQKSLVCRDIELSEMGQISLREEGDV